MLAASVNTSPQTSSIMSGIACGCSGGVTAAPLSAQTQPQPPPYHTDEHKSHHAQSHDLPLLHLHITLTQYNHWHFVNNCILSSEHTSVLEVTKKHLNGARVAKEELQNLHTAAMMTVYTKDWYFITCKCLPYDLKIQNNHTSDSALLNIMDTMTNVCLLQGLAENCSHPPSNVHK